MRKSNNWIGLVNFITFLSSIPILGGGIWLSTRANTIDCMKFLQWPIIIIGISIMVVSLAGFLGACYRYTFLMYVYLWAMFIIIVSLIGFIIFGFAVTNKGEGRPVLNRGYLEYHLQDYYPSWLEERVARSGYWVKIATCVRDSNACGKLTRSVNGYPETDQMFFKRTLDPIQSGCCKPPTGCGYVYNNETIWTGGNNMVGSDVDCLRWNNDQRTLCYNCDSCKAGVIATIKHSWRKVSIINIVILIILVILYVVGCAAFRHDKKMDNNNESYDDTRMEKSHPARIHF